MKQALGKGLNALIPDKGEEIIPIPVDKIFPSPDQPRKVFDEKSLKELAMSIQEKGIIQPIIVQRAGDGTFKIVAGERRWRASRMAGIEKIPCLIREVKLNDSLEIALIENIQRENLNPVETAEAFQRLIKEFHLKQEDLANKVGKDRATVANYIRLLNLPLEIKNLVNDGKLSMGHARSLLSVEDKPDQIRIAKKVIKYDLSVRDTEKLCRKVANLTSAKSAPRDPQIASLEDELIGRLGTKVRIVHKGERGKIEIEYYSLDELERLLAILRR